MNSILRYIQEMGFYMLLILPLIIIVRFFRIKRKKIRTTLLHEFGIAGFFMFLTGLLSQTILPSVYTNGGEVIFVNGNHQAINLELFRVFTYTFNAIKYLDLWQPFVINFLGNIVIFIPIGFLLPLLWKKYDRAWRTIGIGFLLSLTIEILQLPQMRSSDIDDLWLNSLGTSVGYIVYKNFPTVIKDRFKLR
ncbi:VanZ family protein [Paenisporosarcina indica]|uniref:VanZ family protein n=1 Tax=Paenisporosarcina indica TaxID=650093 RepID=UPI0009502208|nr:VanZ family protein [Paenisporosarcina indica]